VPSGLERIFGPQGFDATTAPVADFDAVPPGRYLCTIEAAQVKETKKGDGAYLEVTLRVLDSPYLNRKLWHRINIMNPSEMCQQIGRATLATLTMAAGFPNTLDESLLVGRQVIAHVSVRQDQNVIRKYSGPNVTTETSPAPPPRSPSAATLPPGSQPPLNTALPEQSSFPFAKPPWQR